MGVDESILRRAGHGRGGGNGEALPPEQAEPEMVGGGKLLDTETETAIASDPDIDHTDSSGDEWAEPVADEAIAGEAGRSYWPAIALGFLAVAAAVWIALYVMAELLPLPANPDLSFFSSHLIAITPPLLLLVLIALFVQRGSAAELRRHAVLSRKMTTRGAHMADQIASIRGEIESAHELIETNITKLAELSDGTVSRLSDNAGAISMALSDSERQVGKLDDMSDRAINNLNTFRRELPPLIDYARDLSNSVGEAGLKAIEQLRDLESGWERVEERQRMGGAGLEKLSTRIAELDEYLTNLLSTRHADVTRMTAEISDGLNDAGEKMIGQFAEADVRISALIEQSRGAIGDFVTALDHQLENAQDRTRNLITEVNDAGESFDKSDALRDSRIREQISALDDGMSRISQLREAESTNIAALIEELDGKLQSAAARVDQLNKKSSDQSAHLALALAASEENIKKLTTILLEHRGSTDVIIEKNRELAELLASNNETIDVSMPANLARFADMLSNIRSDIADQSRLTREMEEFGEQLTVKFGTLDRSISAQHKALGDLDIAAERSLTDRRTDAEKLNEKLACARELLSDLSENGGNEIERLVERLRDTGSQMSEIIRDSIADMDSEKLNAALIDDQQLAAHIRKRAEEIRSEFVETLGRGLQHAEQGTDILERKLARIEEMTASLESRLTSFEDEFPTVEDDGFARRMALLTESLNSAAIDVAKILSTEITDKAWQDYLKGDRGVFTRRAVRLLDSQQSRNIAEQYEWDSEFRMQVNRYIHDFEEMMRQLLSTRDGHRISVTLLSSDIGKLYVALAQAIERLRS